MAKASKKDIKKKIAARLEKIAKHEGKIKKLKKALKQGPTELRETANWRFFHPHCALEI